MKYYKVQVVLGHMGKNNGLPIWVYVKAKDILKAMQKARHIPAVKHSRIPTQIIEITKKEYDKGIESNNYYNTIDQMLSD